jgi:ABC-type transport system involved in cytochrome c biogenesis permease subunit
MKENRMLDTSIFWLRAAACLYAIGLLHSMFSIIRRNQSLYGAALATFRVGVVLQAVALVELAMAYGRLPLDNFYGTVDLCAFLVALVFLFVESRFHFAGTAVAMFPLVFLMTLIAALERPVATWPNVGVRDAWLIVHILLVLAGYAALLLTATASVFYLVQERRLKNKKASAWLEKLPPLATLDNVISTSMGLGFVLLTLGVIFAITWASTESGTRWIGDPKTLFSLFTWALCLLMIVLRASAGWRGRKAALMALTVLGCSVLTWVAHIGLRPVLSP